MSKIYQIIYASSASELFDEEELRDLLKLIRLINEKNDITGLLAYKDGNFIQALEGEEQKVIELMAKIERDARHGSIIELYKGFIEERQFFDWRMAFLNLPTESSQGFSDFLDPHKSAHEQSITSGNAKRLMLNFRTFM